MTQFKVLFSLILILELFGFPSPILAQISQNRKMIIVIDPGHGGKDSGTVGINGIQEKDVALKIGKQIVELNNTLFKTKNEIFLTRYKDTFISLGDRTKIAKALKADVFISLHCNHSDNPNARGLEVFVSYVQGNFSRESILFAYELQKGLKKNLGFESRGVKFGDFQVLRETVNECQSMLFEIGFLSNISEAEYFSYSKSIDTVALAILIEISN